MKLYSVSILSGTGQLFDIVSIRKSFPLGYNYNVADQDMNRLNSRRIIPTRQYTFGSFQFTSVPNVSLSGAYRPINCSNGLSEFVLKNSFSIGAPTMSRSSAASGPVTGMFNLAWNGQSLNGKRVNLLFIQMDLYYR